MTEGEIRDLPSNRGRWGAGDELGTLNLITDEVRARAVAEARTGRTVSLARPVRATPLLAGGVPAIPGSPAVYQAMMFTGSPSVAMAEVLVMTPHRPELTHIDALTHVVHAGIDPQARQAVILTVGAAWQAEYELYAHQAAAAEAGLPAEAIAAIVADAAPAGLSFEADLARRLARAAVRDGSIPDALYRECTEVFGVGGAIALLHLIGQYQLVSSLLVFFAVPSPAGRATHAR